MLTSTPHPALSPAATTSAPGWVGLLRGAALVLALGAVLNQLAGRFLGPSLVVLAVLCVTGAILAGRRPRTAAVLLGVTALLNVTLHGWVFGLLLEGPGAGLVVAVSVLDLVCSLLIITAAVAVLSPRTGRRPESRTPRLLGLAGVVAVVLATAMTFSLYATRSSDVAVDGEPVLVSTGLRVDPQSLTVSADGASATVVFQNDDLLYPRSIDIDALDLHVVVPPRTGQRIELPVGQHEFYDFVTMSEATSGTITVLP
ncbi:hypothetical protein [Ornithinicoccus halotolerans]|uniref:hypothetical protein n=1 Tax=Ornithinicoccus halotolerans TaxID=1748220 RepID=UPI001296316A|nr:hypothetical protein [Ornithinicoccus halotolerans]